MKNKKIVLSILSLLLLVLFFLHLTTSNNTQNDNKNIMYGINRGQTPYEFEYKGLDGNTIKLSDFKGKKVFLNFWASWCGPCRVEIPELIKVAESRDDIIILGINILESETSEKDVKNFIKQNNMTFPIGFTTPKISEYFQAFTLPTSYFINRDGTVYMRLVGPMNQDQLNATFDAMP